METYKRRLYEAYISSGHRTFSVDLRADLERSRPYRESLVRKFFPEDKDAAIVDLGCGTGLFVHMAHELGYRNAIGIDAAQALIEAGQAQGIQNISVDLIEDFLASTEDQSYDFVALMDVLEHMDRAEAMETLDGVLRILKPGGGFLMHVPNAGGIFPGVIRYGDLTHELAFTKTSLNQMLSTVGFESVAVFEDLPVTNGLKSAARRLIWIVGALPFRLMYAAETGSFDCCLTQNVTVFSRRPKC